MLCMNITNVLLLRSLLVDAATGLHEQSTTFPMRRPLADSSSAWAVNVLAILLPGCLDVCMTEVAARSSGLSGTVQADIRSFTDTENNNRLGEQSPKTLGSTHPNHNTQRTIRA